MDPIERSTYLGSPLVADSLEAERAFINHKTDEIPTVLELKKETPQTENSKKTEIPVFQIKMNQLKMVLAALSTLGRIILAVIPVALRLLFVSPALTIYEKRTRNDKIIQTIAPGIISEIQRKPTDNSLLGHHQVSSPASEAVMPEEFVNSKLDSDSTSIKSYHDRIKNNFTSKAFEKKFGVKPDLEQITLSRETDVAHYLANRLLQPSMVGKTIFLINVEDGVERETLYKIDKYFESSHGVVGYGLVPLQDSKAPPRLIFRGTAPKKIKKRGEVSGLAADLAGAIGKKAFEDASKEITEWLKEATQEGKTKAFISGHSLGGAMTQRTAAANPSLVGQVHTYNSPRVETELVDPLLKNGSLSHMKITHVITDGDRLVPQVGGGTRFSLGTLLQSGDPESKEVISVLGGGHRTTKIADYCITGKTFNYKELSVSEQLRRNMFWAAILNYIRPQINLK